MADLDHSGRVIRGFKVVKPIGQGKFSIVYKAEQVSDNFPVALKIVKVITS
jgi:serine/threonine protein kinase